MKTKYYVLTRRYNDLYLDNKVFCIHCLKFHKIRDLDVNLDNFVISCPTEGCDAVSADLIPLKDIKRKGYTVLEKQGKLRICKKS